VENLRELGSNRDSWNAIQSTQYAVLYT